MTAKDAYLLGREHLAAAGVPEPAIEAEMLLRFALGVDRARLYTQWEATLAEALWERYRRLLEERARGRPAHYIVGEREFMGTSFVVDERVMIPRPETELLVEFAADWAHRAGASILVDAGTGSGCIAVSLARTLRQVTVYATDISPGALAVAQDNARRHGVDGRVQLWEGDLLSALPPLLAGRVDAVVSNPPYVPEAQAASLAREIRDFEPHAAVFAPGDGTVVHRRLIEAAVAWLRPGGLLAMEVGLGQAPSVAAAFKDDGRYADAVVRRDLAGVERVVAGEVLSNVLLRAHVLQRQ